MESPVKIAILDLYDGEPNQGMRCIKEIIGKFGSQVDTQVFDVRGKEEIPGTKHDIYICSGGPGNPMDGDGHWDKRFYGLIQDLWNWNTYENLPKKHVSFICHSFQMACHLFGVGKITERRSESFGIFPIHKTPEGKTEHLFTKLANPFYGADFRHYQVVSPQVERLESLDAHILALEKIRPHVNLERAIMAVRFSNEFIGVQFHPEANAEGMLVHFSDENRKTTIINKHGKEKYDQIIRDLKDPNRIELTHDTILPDFITNAINQLKEETILVH